MLPVATRYAPVSWSACIALVGVWLAHSHAHARVEACGFIPSQGCSGCAGTASSDALLDGRDGPDDFMCGYEGNDFMRGLGGNDSISGGSGNDPSDDLEGTNLLRFNDLREQDVHSEFVGGHRILTMPNGHEITILNQLPQPTMQLQFVAGAPALGVMGRVLVMLGLGFAAGLQSSRRRKQARTT